MSTELKEATIKVVLDTRKAVEQAEKQGEEEEKARASGRDREHRRERGNGSGASPGGRGAAGRDGRDGEDGWRDRGRQAFDAARATANGELWGLLRASIPYLGTAELTAKYLPGVVGGMNREAGQQLLKMSQVIEELKAKLSAIGETQEQLKRIAVVQLRLGGGADWEDLVGMGRKLYRINTVLDQQRLQEEKLGGYLATQALTRQTLDLIREATKLGAGK